MLKHLPEGVFSRLLELDMAADGGNWGTELAGRTEVDKFGKVWADGPGEEWLKLALDKGAEEGLWRGWFKLLWGDVSFPGGWKINEDIY